MDSKDTPGKKIKKKIKKKEKEDGQNKLLCRMQ